MTRVIIIFNWIIHMSWCRYSFDSAFFCKNLKCFSLLYYSLRYVCHLSAFTSLYFFPGISVLIDRHQKRQRTTQRNEIVWKWSKKFMSTNSSIPSGCFNLALPFFVLMARKPFFMSKFYTKSSIFYCPMSVFLRRHHSRFSVDAELLLFHLRTGANGPHA